MLEERWKDVPDHPGYQVSDLGAVRTIDRMVTGKDGRSELHRGKVLKPQVLRTGYHEIYLSDGGRRKHRTIHSLVAEVFLGKRPEGCDVMHLNGNRSDNRASNLSYGSRSDNLRGCYAYGGKKGNGKLSLEDVDDIRRRIECGESCVDIAKTFSVNSAAIYHIRNGTAFSWYDGRE